MEEEVYCPFLHSNYVGNEKYSEQEKMCGVSISCLIGPAAQATSEQERENYCFYNNFHNCPKVKFFEKNPELFRAYKQKDIQTIIQTNVQKTSQKTGIALVSDND